MPNEPGHSAPEYVVGTDTTGKPADATRCPLHSCRAERGYAAIRFDLDLLGD